MPDHPEDLFSILEIPHEKHGITYRFMQNGLTGVSDLREKRVVEIQKKYFRALHIDPDQWIRMYFKIAYRRDDVNSIQEAAKLLSPDRQSQITMLAKRFGCSIEFPVYEEKNPHRQTRLEEMQYYFFNSSDLLGIMRPYLSPEDEAKLNNASRFLHQTGSLSLLSKIKSFQAALQVEIERKPFCQGRGCPTLEIFAFMIFAIGTAISIRYLVNSNSQIVGIRNEMRNTSCAELTAYTRYCDPNDPLSDQSPCQSYCDQLDNLFPPNFGGLLGTSWGSPLTLAFLIAMLRAMLPNNLFAGRERFDKMNLNDFSDHLRYKATRLFAEFKEDPEFRLTMVSTIREVRNTLNDYVRRLDNESQRQTLFKSEGVMDDELSPVVIDIARP